MFTLFRPMFAKKHGKNDTQKLLSLSNKCLYHPNQLLADANMQLFFASLIGKIEQYPPASYLQKKKEESC